jgi:hypothetical protein
MGRLGMTNDRGNLAPSIATVLAIGIVALVAFGLLGEMTMSALHALMAFWDIAEMSKFTPVEAASGRW